MAKDEEYSMETIEATRMEAVENITKVPTADQELERQPSCKEKYTRGRFGPQKKTKRSKYWKTPIIMGRPLYSEGSWKTRIILPNRWQRQNHSLYMEHGQLA
jgi:hypothetical protein